MVSHLSGGSGALLRRWPWRRRSSGSKLALAVLPLALVMAWPAAPVVAQAAGTSSTSADSSCLLGQIGCSSSAASSSPSPSCLFGLIGCGSATGPNSGPCVAGLLLCGGNVVSQPSPCVNGSLLCGSSPPPTPCTGGEVLCSGAIIGPGNPPPGPSGGKRNPASTAGSSVPLPLPGTTNVSVALGVPPGVGLIPAAEGSFGVSGPNPDGFSDLLSLSIRDGLAPGGFKLWPALAMLQALLLLVIVGAFAARQVLQASKTPEG